MSRTVFALITLFLMKAALAQSVFEHQFETLKEKRDAALRAATDPIEEKYRKSLNQLFLKATQAGDLETATKIKAVLDTAGSSDFLGKWVFRRDGLEPQHRELLAGGAVMSGTSNVGTWTSDGKTLTVRYADGVSYFQLPPVNGTLAGSGVDERKLAATRN